MSKRTTKRELLCLTIAAIVVQFVAIGSVRAQEETLANAVRSKAGATSPADVLTRDQWRRVDQAVARALQWFASQQDSDGSFPTLPTGQPGVTSLCTMAFIAHGNIPGEGRYGGNLERAADYALDCQKENGLFALLGPDGPVLIRQMPDHEVGVCAAYNHAIASLTMSEMYGMLSGGRAKRCEGAIQRALRVSLEMQRWHKNRSVDRGGWRYVDDVDNVDADLSITGWELMFLRSSRNAGFDVAKEPIDEAVAYVRRCFDADLGTFEYFNDPYDRRSRGMAGAGILALAHAGYHNSPEAHQAGKWLLEHDFRQYNAMITTNDGKDNDRYHYGLFNSTQAMYQLGGDFWAEFFPATVETLLANQQADGSWPADSNARDGAFGNAYTTALVVMALGAPNQLLPVFQR